MQALNIVYTNVTALILHKGCQKYFSQKTADAVFSLYVLLLGFSPYFFSMYTDIPPLPFISLQIFLVLGLLKGEESGRQLVWRSILRGLMTSLAFFFRPTVMILLIAVFGVLFFKKNWKKFFLTLVVFACSFAISYSPLHYWSKHQTEVPIMEGEGLAKGHLLFINLGLTFNGPNQ